jgi:hypothetical protein
MHTAQQLPAYSPIAGVVPCSSSKPLKGQAGLSTTAQAQHQVECRLLLDVVISQSTAVLQLLTSEDQALLVWWDAYRTTALAKT